MLDLTSFLMPGMQAVIHKLVDEADTAANYGSKSLGHLIATPAFAGMIIDASVKAVEDRLPAGFISVTTKLEITHKVPTCLGMTLRVKSTLKEIHGDRLVFDIVACDEAGEIGFGTHERAVVNRDRLMLAALQRLEMK